MFAPSEELALIASIVVWAGYVLLIAALWRLLRVDYARITASESSIIRGLLIPIGLGSVALIAVTTLWGWWPVALFAESARGGWMLVVPLLLLAGFIAGVVRVDFRSRTPRFWVLLAVGTLLVGFAEELVARGLLWHGAQSSGWSAVATALFTSLCFSLLHAINGFFGQPWRITALQLGTTFLAGIAFAVTREATGTLLVAMALHALWDFAVLALAASDKTLPKAGFLSFAAAILLAAIAVWFL